MRLLLALLLIAPAALAQPADYGATDFPTSGAAEAQGAFLRGLLMLHSFEYEDAREAFQEARRLDPGFAMAAWGEALTHNHPIWQEQDRDAARAALGPDLWVALTSEREIDGVTEREASYLQTLGVLYGEGDKEARDHAYAEALGALAAAYPDDLDAAAFHALALLGTAHDGRDFSIYMRAAAIAEEVFAASPRHPGAAHYLIHAYDDPVHAPLGLRPAEVYADLAPAASHALHMPSHIYFALGMWEPGAEMNRRSLEAARSRTLARGEPLGGHGWHALYWLHYAELQRGRHAEARRLLDLARDLAEPQPQRRDLVLTMRAHHLVETEDTTLGDGAEAYLDEAHLDEVDLDEADLGAAARSLFADGYLALARGERALAEARRNALRARIEADEDPSPEVRATALALDALLALDAGETDRALGLLAEAAEVEDAMPLAFGPARPTKPVHELFGETLLALGRPDEARLHFEQALARYPRRARSLRGLARTGG